MKLVKSEEKEEEEGLRSSSVVGISKSSGSNENRLKNWPKTKQISDLNRTPDSDNSLTESKEIKLLKKIKIVDGLKNWPKIKQISDLILTPDSDNPLTESNKIKLLEKIKIVDSKLKIHMLNDLNGEDKRKKENYFLKNVFKNLKSKNLTIKVDSKNDLKSDSASSSSSILAKFKDSANRDKSSEESQFGSEFNSNSASKLDELLKLFVISKLNFKPKTGS